MSIQHGEQAKQNFKFSDLLTSWIFIILLLISCQISQIMSYNVTFVEKHNYVNKISKQSNTEVKGQRLLKRSSGKFCFNTSDCTSELPGSLCIENTCTCPQGYLPNNEGAIGCFQVGKNVGGSCNISSQCGEELTCSNHICHCPKGFQLHQQEGINLCLFWHRPTRLVERCRSNEDCSSHDSNSICKKRWCQCNIGYQLFETMLYGRKHKCFKTYNKQQCINSSQCEKLADSSDQFCVCYFGFCHCMSNVNSTLSVFDLQNDHPNWYQRWKKDIILATRLLFITVILFFVPCFIYVTLGVRERSRQLFSQFVQPTRSPAVHYTQRRSSYTRPPRTFRSTVDSASLNSPSSSEAHHVEISLHSNGVNSRIVNYQTRGIPPLPLTCDGARDTYMMSLQNDAKEEDAPPSYDEIMQNEGHSEAPPPPYREL